MLSFYYQALLVKKNLHTIDYIKYNSLDLNVSVFNIFRSFIQSWYFALVFMLNDGLHINSIFREYFEQRSLLLLINKIPPPPLKNIREPNIKNIIFLLKDTVKAIFYALNTCFEVLIHKICLFASI